MVIGDRVLERGRLIRLDGPSVRTLHLKRDQTLKDDSDQDDEGQNFRRQVARISGTRKEVYTIRVCRPSTGLQSVDSKDTGRCPSG